IEDHERSAEAAAIAVAGGHRLARRRVAALAVPEPEATFDEPPHTLTATTLPRRRRTDDAGRDRSLHHHARVEHVLLRAVGGDVGRRRRRTHDLRADGRRAADQREGERDPPHVRPSRTRAAAGTAW